MIFEIATYETENDKPAYGKSPFTPKGTLVYCIRHIDSGKYFRYCYLDSGYPVKVIHNLSKDWDGMGETDSNNNFVDYPEKCFVSNSRVK